MLLIAIDRPFNGCIYRFKRKYRRESSSSLDFNINDGNGTSAATMESYRVYSEVTSGSGSGRPLMVRSFLMISIHNIVHYINIYCH